MMKNESGFTHHMLRITDLDFDGRGLIPAIAQDAETGEVLMMAWTNAEALRRTLETGEAHFWSRSRRALWRKGETSGSVLRVDEVRVDCDGDALLLRVRPAGPACHTGERSCFFRRLIHREDATPAPRLRAPDAKRRAGRTLPRNSSAGETPS